MLYMEFREYQIEYQKAQRMVCKILDKKDLIFQKTQPHSAMGEKVSSSVQSNKMDNYLIDLTEKKIDEKLTEAKEIMMERKELLRLKEEELRKSKQIEDVIFCLKWLDGLGIREIAEITAYSESHVYRLIRIVRKTIETLER